MKSYSKIILVLMLSFSLMGLTGCFGKEKESNTAEKKAVASTQKNDTVTEKKQSTDQENQTTDQTNKSSQITDQANKSSQTNDKEKEKIQSTEKTNKGTQTNNKTDKTSQSTDNGSKTPQSTAKPNTPPAKEQVYGDKEITDFVLNNTRIVQISNINKRTNEKHPDLGPFYVVRGIDLRGEVSEVWIKDLKIFEMVTQQNN